MMVKRGDQLKALAMPDDHDAILQDWKDNAAKHEPTNFRFLRSLKVVSNPERIDALAANLHAEAFSQIDCTRCANCCKTIPPGVSTEDIQIISGHLGLPKEKFIESYLAVDPDEGGYRMKVTPCAFLGEDDRCTIYDVRPEACRQFPHTNKEDFTSRTHLHASNTEACPAVYYIVENMRQRLRRR
jgi:Fe-S-cluster containining protein